MVQSLRRLVITGLISSAAMAEIHPARVHTISTNSAAAAAAECWKQLTKILCKDESSAAPFLNKSSRVARKKTLSSENILYLMVVLKQFWLITKIYLDKQGLETCLKTSTSSALEVPVLYTLQCMPILWFTQTADLLDGTQED
jgi:hypothetical protein